LPAAIKLFGWLFGSQASLSIRCSLLFFFVLIQKKETIKIQDSSEYTQLLPGSYVELLCIVISASVMLLLGLLQPKYI